MRDLTGTGEVTKRRIKEGVGEFPVDCPLEDCAVRVHYSACLAGSSEVGTASGVHVSVSAGKSFQSTACLVCVHHPTRRQRD